MNHTIKNIKSIPQEAVAVKVTNIINPFFIRICEVENHAFKANAISKKLQIYSQKNLNFQEEINELLNLRDSVIVLNNKVNSDIPAWWCRGILGRRCDDQMKYNVFLPDYGIALELQRSDFRKVPKDVFPDEYLTSTIALYEILPASVVKNNKLKGKTIVSIVEEWTESAICCTKELVSAAEMVYFHSQARDENGKLFGELYLVIEDEVVLLSMALVHSLFAINLNDALLKIINRPDSAEKSLVKKINDNLLITQDKLDDCKPKLKVQENTAFKDSSTTIEKGTEEERDSSVDSDSINIQRKHQNMYRKHDQEILIRSEYKCKFIENIEDARFPQNIHKVLNAQHITRPMKIQTYMWPAIAKGLDVISISPSDSGKTFGYLLPIVSYLATEKKISKGTAPTTLILCSSSSNVFTTASLCEEFLTDYKHINVVSALNGQPEKSLLAKIYNGCQVFVSTVPFLARFLKKFRKNNIIDLSRLRHIILDGGDVILDKYMAPAMEIFIKYKVMREKQDLYDNDLSQQVIAVGQQWTKGLSYFMEKFTVYPYVCIGSYMEAAAFSQVQAKLSLVKSENKNNKILEALNNQETTSERTMIICNDAEDAIKLNDLLQSNNKKSLLAHNDMNINDVLGVKDQWDTTISGMYPILICTDHVLSDLNIKDVKWLIHHSINFFSKSRFYYRFSTIRDNWHSTTSRCKVLIMVDDSNNLQFQGLMEIMQRLHALLPSSWLKAADEIAVNLDQNKKAYPICDNVKALGFCPKKSSCSYRHCVLSLEDAPIIDVSIGDTVELMVTYLHNATHYSARLVKCFKKDQKDPVIYSSDNIVRLVMQMQKYFANVENRRGLKNINVGDICAMENIIDNYVRVKILNIVSRNDFDEPSEVIVKFLDYRSELLTVKANQLLYIPGHLEKWQTNILEVFLAGLEPFDREYEWDYCANKAVDSWFKDFYDASSSVIGKVTLHLGNTIWVNTLEMRTKVAGFPEFTVSSLRGYLIENNHAIENKEHLPHLYQLCRTGGLKDLEFDEAIDQNEQVD